MDDFTGWPPHGPTLLADIAADNRAERWEAAHEAALRAPTSALAAALEAEFGPLRVFRSRVNRRFRPSVPPLRTDTGAVARSPGGCALSVVLSATTLTVTAGHWRFDAGQAQRYRAAVAGRDGPASGGAPSAGSDGLASGGEPATAGAGGPPCAGDVAAAGSGDSHAAGGVPSARSDGLAGGGHSAAAGGVLALSRSGGSVCRGEPSAGAGSDPSSGLDDPATSAVPPGPEPDDQVVGDLTSPSPLTTGGDAGEELAAILADLAAVGLTPDAVGQLRSPARGWSVDHPRIGLLSRRGLQVGRSWEVGPWLSTPEPLRRVQEVWRAAFPMVTWLDTHVGPPDVVPPRPRPERAEQPRADGADQPRPAER